MKIVNSLVERKSIYQQLCEQEAIPVMAQPWWLDTVCGKDNWDVSLSFDKKGKLNGALAYFFLKKLGLPIVNMPPLTSRTHLWYTINESPKLYHRHLELQQITENIIQNLPKTAYLNLCLQHEIENHLPFFWAEYQQSTRYTYILPLDKSIDQLFANLSGKARTYIKKAERKLSINNSNNLPELYRLLNLSFEKSNSNNPISFKLLQQIDLILTQKKQCKQYFALDEQGGIHAAAYIIYDQKTATYLLSGIDHHLPNLGAHYLLIWRVIQDFKHQVDYLDFDGSMLQNVAATFARFGGECISYLQISKISHPLIKFWQAWRKK